MVAQRIVADVRQASVVVVTCLHERAVIVHQPSAEVDGGQQLRLEAAVGPVASQKGEAGSLGLQRVLLRYPYGLTEGERLRMEGGRAPARPSAPMLCTFSSLLLRTFTV